MTTMEERKTPEDDSNLASLISDAVNGSRFHDSDGLASAIAQESSCSSSSTLITTVPILTTSTAPSQPVPPIQLKREPLPSLSSDPLGVATQLTSELTLHSAPVQQHTSVPCPLQIIPSGKTTNFCPKHPHIEVTLDGKDLWDDFYRRGTEMIVNRAGRRMFPGFAITISGLKPKAKYTMKLDMILADNHRFKFLNSRWLAVGSAEPQSPYETYLHPDSPNTGSFWMRHGVSFKKVKITNNKDKPGTNALLHSMHKYYLRLMIEEDKKVSQGDSKQQQLSPRPILSTEFPETTFIAVTAYQNEEVTQLKITNNPFAKAFRENAADMDWETAQALYGSSSSYISPSATMTPSGSYFMSPSPSPWTLNPPMLSPHSMPHTFHSISPQGISHYSPDSQFRHPLPPTPQAEGFFQWPPPRASEMLHSASSYAPLPPLVSSYHHPVAATHLHPPPTHLHPPPTHLHHHPILEASQPTADGTLVLPDFTSTFAVVTTCHHP